MDRRLRIYLDTEGWLYMATVLRCSTAVRNLCYGGVSSEFVLPANAKRHKHWRETMRRLILFLLALALLPIFRTPASAQMSNMPEDLRARLAEILFLIFCWSDP
jgi:hypothetical protein